MDLDKFKALTELVKQAKQEDQSALEALKLAEANWKNANAKLTDRLKVLDGFIADEKNQAIAI
jgi:hypothetical protein